MGRPRKNPIETPVASVLTAEETEKVLDAVVEDIKSEAPTPKPVKPACVCANCKQFSAPKPGQIMR